MPRLQPRSRPASYEHAVSRKAFTAVAQPSENRALMSNTKNKTDIGMCVVCESWVGLRVDGTIRSHRVGSNYKNSWPCPGGGSEPVAQTKEMRDFLNELKELDFTWEISPSNHIKAVAPDGERFVFSIGGKGRSDQNQRALLNRWIKKNTVVTKPADKEEEMAELSEAALVGLKALEAMVYTIQSQSVDPKIVDDLRAELELVHEDNRKLANERERLVAERNELRASIQALEDSNRILTEDARRLNEIAIKFNQLKGMFG